MAPNSLILCVFDELHFNLKIHLSLSLSPYIHIEREVVFTQNRFVNGRFG